MKILYLPLLLLNVLGSPIPISLSEIRILHCPFNIQTSIAEDSSYIEITYDTSKTLTRKTLTNLDPLKEKEICYVKITFLTESLDYSAVAISGIEYEGNVKLEDVEVMVDTKVVLDGMWGPVSHDLFFILLYSLLSYVIADR